MVWYFEGKSGVQSRRYYPFEWGFNDWLMLFHVATWWFVNINYVLPWPNVTAKIKFSNSLLVLVFNVLYMARITVVAIKWAYLPESIFPLMRRRPLTPEQYKMIHFLTGWVSHKNQTGLAREIGQSMARLEIDINKMEFKFRDEHHQPNIVSKRSTKLSLRRCETYTTYGNLLVPYLVFCASRFVANRSKWIGKMSLIVSPIIACLPIVARSMWGFESWNEYISVVTVYGPFWYFGIFFNNSLNLAICVMFCSVIELDFKRRYAFTRFCTRLIELKKSAFKGMVQFPSYKQYVVSPDVT